jgi:hypothetical protein
MLITKSKFVGGVQCLKRLHFIVYSPELEAQRDEARQAIAIFTTSRTGS